MLRSLSKRLKRFVLILSMCGYTLIILWLKESRCALQQDKIDYQSQLSKSISFLETAGTNSNDMEVDGKIKNKTYDLQLQKSVSESQNRNTNYTDIKWKVKDRSKYVSHLLQNAQSSCDGRFIGYDKDLAKLTNVVIDPNFSKIKKLNKIDSVKVPREEEEYFLFEHGFFTLNCSHEFTYKFSGSTYLQKWMEALDIRKDLSIPKKRISRWTVALTRVEYAHIYFTLLDIFNVYTVINLFNLDPEKTDILIIDAHPKGMLDDTWGHLFGEVTRLSDIKDPIHYDNLVWNQFGHGSIINQHIKPFVADFEGFKDFVLSCHGIRNEESLDCKKLRILFIWRHDYVAHPRNPSGHVTRKFANEDEMINASRNAFSNDHIEGIQLDALKFKDQLKLVANTDILIGMHGAGLAHAMFLPKRSALIELFPLYKNLYTSHFTDICRWRGLHYSAWQNRDKTMELNGDRTKMNTEKVVEMISNARKWMCPKSGLNM